MPPFDPLRVRGSGQRLRRAVLRRRRAMAAGLAMTAAALAATGAGGAEGAAPDARAEAAAGAVASGAPTRRLPAAPVEMVSAPVRIADAATVRLLRVGDRVDVIAAPAAPLGSPGVAEGPAEARVVAAGAQVAEIPQEREATSDGGALVVLAVPRATATALAGASATSRLAVTLC
ncbi:hypothetical protein ABZ707_09540 [Streptomyces sp. NPDC006923]|uniref:hypothetical protein n=1 Tax=Streptomyces sp. NPDC006923 TaxID=3155355 RepID=UPI0033C85D6A